MKQLIQKLKQFLPAEVQVATEGSLLRLLTAEGEPCGIVDLDEDENLIGFDLQIKLPDEEGCDARVIAQQFAAVFYPEAAEVIQEDYAAQIQSTLIRLAEKDAVHHLPIPGAGLAVEVHDSGLVTAAQLYRNTYTLIDSDELIDVAEAKQKLLSETPVAIAVEGGSTVYKLSDQVIGMHADGTVLFTELPPVLKDIEAAADHKDWASLMGMTEDFVNYYNEDGVQLWAESALVDNHPIDEIPDQVAVRKNAEVLFYSGATPWNKDRRYTEEELKQQAVHFLSAVTDHPLGEWKHAEEQLAPDAAIEDELEPTYIFLFAYTKLGIPVEGIEASIHVGIHSGLIRECIVDRVPDAVRFEKQWMPGKKAKQQLGDLLQLELAWVSLHEENRYELVYVRTE
ncbi:hypothetical protein CHI12_05890 [Terribacillus saccharophilus]|uniref:Uncharacterized protein n=1 Tax=Terribacillus saccharophilus TaxID=361277 RepID=A0A268HF86_9BACI|nr:hypothetical protein [Terribacillus saccharophilus]PAE08520.1 hypothetical protein CHI12_05890 [Terribacillus saccharophilus]